MLWFKKDKEEYYCLCEERVNGKWSGNYSIRMERDCSPTRFRILGKYKTFREAEDAWYFYVS